MKKLFLISFLFCGVVSEFVYAQPLVLNCNQITKGSIQEKLCSQSYHLLRSLLVQQAQKSQGQKLDINSMRLILKTGQLQIENLEEFLGKSPHEQNQILLQKMLQQSGQSAFLSNSSAELEPEVNSDLPGVSTGTRGGGFKPKEQQIWY